jgi:hypothetical protein
VGSWGAGLYADDFALDLRADVSGIARLPISGDEILGLLRASAGEAAESPGNDEHARFWLVVADQFQKRGIPCPEVTRKALDIIDTGADVKTLADLGMAAPALRKRAATLRELRVRLAADTPPRARNVLKKPQHLIMRPGEVYAYPTSGGEPYNPYFTSAERELYERASHWKADGWGAMVILKAEVAYGYLTWYLPLIVRKEMTQKPALESLRNEPWTRQRPGTCSPAHFKRLGLEQIGSVSIGETVLTQLACSNDVGARAALLDVSIASCMDVASDHPKNNIFIQHRLNAQPAIKFCNCFSPISS